MSVVLAPVGLLAAMAQCRGTKLVPALQPPDAHCVSGGDVAGRGELTGHAIRRRC